MKKIIVLCAIMTAPLIISSQTNHRPPSPPSTTKLPSFQVLTIGQAQPLLQRSENREFPYPNDSRVRALAKKSRIASIAVEIPHAETIEIHPPASPTGSCQLSYTQKYICVLAASFCVVFAIAAATAITCRRYCKN